MATISQTSQEQKRENSSMVAPVVSSSNSPKSGGKRKMLWVGVGIISLVALFFLASQVVPKILIYLTKATNAPGAYSLANSYVFGSPLSVKANGEEKIRVTAFLFDARGRGVPGQQIELRIKPKTPGTRGLPQIKEIQSVTDDFGQAIFEVTSTVAGQFVVSALVNGQEFPQTVTLTFR